MTEQQGEQNKKSAQDKLQEILGFDARKNKAGSGVLGNALKEIKQERDEANQKKAAELIKKAIECCEKMEEAKKQFNGAMQKSEKELNKLISSIEQLGN